MYERFLLIGGTGSGKTSQFLTIPGRKFAYLFDPAATSTLLDADLDYEMFLPEASELDMYPRSVRKSGKQFSDSRGGSEPTLYIRWVEDINKRGSEGFFNDYDAVLVDSLTLLSAACMDRIQYLQAKVGRDDERTDYRIAGDTIHAAIRSITSLPCHVLCTVHEEFRKDEATHKSFNRMTLPGGSRLSVPRLFSNIWSCSCESTADEVKYLIQTRPSRDNPTIRTSRRFSDLEMYHDVTIRDWDNPEEYGIGKLLKGLQK